MNVEHCGVSVNEEAFPRYLPVCSASPEVLTRKLFPDCNSIIPRPSTPPVFNHLKYAKAI